MCLFKHLLARCLAWPVFTISPLNTGSLEDSEQEENAEDTPKFNICCIINKIEKRKKKLLDPQSTSAGMMWFL
jgi:hypothetical protein